MVNCVLSATLYLPEDLYFTPIVDALRHRDPDYSLVCAYIVLYK